MKAILVDIFFLEFTIRLNVEKYSIIMQLQALQNLERAKFQY